MTTLSRGLDAATDLTRFANQIKAAGFDHVGRYTKNVTRAEIDALHAAGLGVFLIFEGTADRSLAGAAAGQADGTKARAQARALGAPDTVRIYTTCDTDPTGSQVATVKAYGDGFAAAAGVSGFYACGAVLAVSALTPWLAGASGWNGSKAYDATGKWVMKQGPDLGGRAASWAGINWPALGFDYDPNLIAGDIGAWMPDGVSRTQFPPLINPMQPQAAPPASVLPDLKAAQAQLGVTADGIWGPKTAAAFAQHYGG